MTETFEQIVERLWAEQPACGAGIVLNFATRLRDELAKGQEPVGYMISSEDGSISPRFSHQEPSAQGWIVTPLYTSPILPAPAGVPDGWKLVPEDLLSHLGDWEEACRLADAVSACAEDDGYWKHQLKVLSRIKSLLSAAPVAPAYAAAKDAETPRCKCCGYLVTESEHRGCLRSGSEMAKDAERYRMVRRGQHWSVIDGIGNDLCAEVLDSAIDAAMGKEGK